MIGFCIPPSGNQVITQSASATAAASSFMVFIPKSSGSTKCIAALGGVGRDSANSFTFALMSGITSSALPALCAAITSWKSKSSTTVKSLSNTGSDTTTSSTPARCNNSAPISIVE